MTTLLWILAVVLVIGGIVTGPRTRRRQCLHVS